MRLLAGGAATGVALCLVFVASCGGTDRRGEPSQTTGESPSAVDTQKKVKLGEPFKMAAENERDQSDVPEGAEVKVLATQCGVEYSFEDLKKRYGTDEPPEAAPGKQYCEAKFQAKNVATVPIVWTAQGALLVTSAGEFDATEAADEVTDALNQRLNDSGVHTGYFMGEPTNPGDAITQMFVWEIPDDQKPVAIHLIDQPVIEADPDALAIDILVEL